MVKIHMKTLIKIQHCIFKVFYLLQIIKKNILVINLLYLMYFSGYSFLFIFYLNIDSSRRQFLVITLYTHFY